MSAMLAARERATTPPARLRRVNIAAEAHDSTVMPKIPRGYIRPATQGIWRTVMTDALDLAPVRGDRRATLVAVATQLMWSADWDTLTTRPTWAALVGACQRATGHGSRRTIARAIATLIEMHLIARVASGRCGAYAPGHGNRNEAAVYVLIVPGELAATSAPEPTVDRNGTPPRSVGFSSFVSLSHPTHARTRARTAAEPLRGTQPSVEPSRAPQLSGAPRRQSTLWSLHASAQGPDDMRLAATEFRRRLPVLQALTPNDVRAVIRPFLLAGWTVADLLHAVDHTPHGPWHHTADTGVPRNQPHRVRGWLRHRLAAWSTEGTVQQSPSQRRRADHDRREALRRLDAERERTRRAHTVGMPAIVRATRDHLKHQNLGVPFVGGCPCCEL